jgi:hypothetical protein
MHVLQLFSLPVGAVSQPSGTSVWLLLMPCAPETAVDGCQETDGRGSALGRCAWCLGAASMMEWSRNGVGVGCHWLCRAAWMNRCWMLNVGCVKPQTSEVGFSAAIEAGEGKQMAIGRHGGRECAPESELCRWATAM